MTVFNYQKDAQGIVTITMDMTGPVNTVNDEFYNVMLDTVFKLEKEGNLTGVIFTSAKKTFFAGGDIKMLMALQPGEEDKIFDVVEANKKLFRRLELLPVPVVSAINGAALGGGFELALSCNYRVAINARHLEIGLPEVSLGLLPGAGGVVRLTNLLGLEKALPLLLEGKKLKAEPALKLGLIDELVESAESLIPKAKKWILANKENTDAYTQPWDKKGNKVPGGKMNRPAIAQMAMMAPHMLMKKTQGLLPAPEAILDIAVQALTVDFDTALRIESRKFSSLPTSKEAKNMMSAFFFQLNQVNGGVSRPKDITQTKVSKVGIIGAGMMGQGIATVSAKAGIEVILKDVSLEAAEKGKAYTAMVMDKAIARGRADEAKKTLVLNLITATDSDEDLAGCDLIIEAVFENLELKNKITRATEGNLTKEGVWGSNTSTLPITKLAEASNNPEKFIGIHFFSPVDKMPLVEIICGEQTSDKTLAKAFDYVQQIRKTPIVVNDSLGFFTSRTFASQLSEAAQLVAEGIHPVRVDNLGKALGMPVGPLTVNDEVSLRLGVEIIETQVAMGLRSLENDPRPLATSLSKALVKEYNRGGRYHGDGGYFNYNEDGKTIWPKLLELYYKPEVEISDRDIKDRLLFSNVLETLHCLEEGVLRNVPDANIGSIFGIGAPIWTGGYLQFINTFGLQAFKQRCEELAERYGERFNPPQILDKKIAANETFE
ncbi:MAG: 3-hydroxyacyl-CoA dehydrogenase [Colwelliaceae bacterium]|nr:3-hydroxyacyl-CoA dehydrogenase [Colwelliaceae bacterium]